MRTVVASACHVCRGRRIRRWLHPVGVLVLIGTAAITVCLAASSAAFADQTSNSGTNLAASPWFSPTGLTHYWRLDGSAVDVVGSNDGVVLGAATIPGSLGSALAFDGVDDRVTVPEFSYMTEFTLTFAFKVDVNSGSLFKYVYSHGDINLTNSVNVFLVEAGHATDPNVLRTVIRDSDDSLDNFALQTNVASLIGDGQWHTYAVVSAASGLAVYVDGVLRASDPLRGTGGVDPSGPVLIGSRVDLDVDRYYLGGLDTLQVYDRALSLAEVLDLGS